MGGASLFVPHPTGGCFDVASYGIDGHAATNSDKDAQSHASGGPRGLGITGELAPTVRAGRVQAVAQAMSIAFSGQMSNPQTDVEMTQTLGAKNPMAVCTPINTQMALRGEETSNSAREGVGIGGPGDPGFTLQAAHSHAVQSGMAVRRLMPVECERLQGFPDNFTDIRANGKPTPDGPRYKALGNSMAVPVMRWIGERIAQVEAITNEKDEAA